MGPPHDTDSATGDFVQLSLWSAIEIYVGIMCACMPGMRAFYTRIFRGGKWEKTGPSQAYHYGNCNSGAGQPRSATNTFGSSETKNRIKRKDDFEMMVSEVDVDSESQEDLTNRRKEERSWR